MIRHYIFLILFIGLLACGHQQKVPAHPVENYLVQTDLGERLDSVLSPYVDSFRMHTDNTAGLAVGVINGDDIIYARTWGYADMMKNTPADFNTLFHIASVSKPFTAAAIVHLLSEHKLGLEDKLITHIPEFKMQDERYKDITIRHVLTHTSGIPRHVSAEDWLHPVNGPDALNNNLKNVAEYHLDFKPGSEYSYSNSAVDILGIVIERVSGQRFGDYIKEHILDPSGMTRSTYYKSGDALPDGWAAAHSYGVETMPWHPYPYAEHIAPSSGLQTSLLDMCRWGRLHLGHGTIDGHMVIDSSSFHQMITPQFETPWDEHIGLLWYLQSYVGERNIMHLGNDTGFDACMYIYPDMYDGVGIVVMANRDFSGTGRIGLAAAEILSGLPAKDYEVSSRYAFGEKYRAEGIDSAMTLWESMKKDTTDMYYTNDRNLLTAAAVLENEQQSAVAQDILLQYVLKDSMSSYAYRLLGNTYVHLNDTAQAVASYKKTLEIDPDYEKGKAALRALEAL